MGTTNDKPKSICFVYRSAHYALLNNTGVLVGGAEMQQKILADALASKGWKIYFVTEQVDNKRVHKLNRNLMLYSVLNYTGGNKYLRKSMILPINLWKILKHIDADIYYQRNTNYPIGIVALFCKMYRKKFVLAGANNWNFDKGNERNLKDPLEILSARFAIKAADKIIVQSKIQGELLKRNYGRQGIVFYNIFPSKNQRKIGRHILWVGRIEKHKKPKWLLELAKSLPDYNFIMVGGRGSDLSLKLAIETQAAEIKNLRYLGHQPFETVENLFDQADIFIGTYNPSTEGFPNTFLQAWSRGIPVISSMDLDGLIFKNNLGIVAESVSQMKKAVQLLMSNENIDEYSHRIQAFFDQNFSASNRIEDFERILTHNA